MRLRIQQSGPKSLNDAIRFSIKIEAFVEQDDKKEGMWDMPEMQATTKWHMMHTQIKMSGKSYGMAYRYLFKIWKCSFSKRSADFSHF